MILRQGETMRQESAKQIGLVASGHSRHWDIAIDQSLDGEDAWLAEIEGPQVYLSFQLRNAKVIPEALGFLSLHMSCPRKPGRSWRAKDDSLVLGKFGAAAVSLLWDNEEPGRCFLVIGPRRTSILRVGLEEEDVKMWTEALQQVLGDLPAPDTQKAGSSRRRRTRQRL